MFNLTKKKRQTQTLQNYIPKKRLKTIQKKGT